MSKIRGFIGETIVYGFGNVFSRVFAMLLIPLYAQYLGKIDYSNLVMLQSVFTILTFLLALNSGVFFYYYEHENIRYRKIVLTSWFYYQLAITVCVVLLLWICSPFLLNLFLVNDSNAFDIRWCLVLMGIQLFPYIFNITNINYFRIERKPRSVVVIVLLEAFFTLIFVYYSLAVKEYGLFGVVFSQIAARLIVSILYSRVTNLYVRIKYFSQKLIGKLLLFSWPFIVSSVLTVIIINVDKFIGTQTLQEKSDVAILSLAMQLVLPISVLADMIRMAIGPFIMSIRKESDAERNYQKIYDLTIYSAAVVLIVLVLFTPFLTILLADITYINVIYIIPLLGFANLLSLAANQFCVSFSLVKKNIFILYAFAIGGIVTISTNAIFMGNFGFIVSGYSQILSYLFMCAFLFYFGRKLAKMNIKIRNSLFLLVIVIFFLCILPFLNPMIARGQYLLLLLSGITFLSLLTVVFIYQQKINPIQLLKAYLKKG